MKHLKPLSASLLIPAVVAVSTLLPSQDARAAIATTLLNPDPSVTQMLQDITYEAIQKNTNPGSDPAVLQLGDILYGMQVIDKVRTGDEATDGLVPFTGETFTAVFAARVIEGPFVNTNFNLGPVTPAEFLSLTGVTPTGTGTIAVVYSDAFTNVPGDAVDPNAAGGTTTAIQTAVSSTPLWEFGIAAGGNGSLFINTDTISLTTIADPNDVKFFGSLDLTATHNGGPLGLADEMDPAYGNLAPNELQFVGKLSQVLGQPNNFAFTLDTNFFINAVPEPSTTMALAGMIGMGIVGLVIRRRK